jgi:erythromycin esterase-like protein
MRHAQTPVSFRDARVHMTTKQWTLWRAAALLLAGACTSGQPGFEAVEGGTGSRDSSAVAAVRASARPITGADSDYDSVLVLAGSARAVFLGEQTHGTHEFYRERTRITQRLVRERDFRAIALEADWPEVERINRYIHGEGPDRNAEAALGAFTDFPLWMWRNTDVRDLVEWLRTHNASVPAERRVSMYGLDVYSLYPSADAVVEYLQAVDPAAATRARAQYACFAPHGRDPQRYGAAASASSCRTQAAAVLGEMRLRAANRPRDAAAASALFSALRNAHSVVNAEEYFRSLYLPGVSTWNLRDQRMEETLLAIDEELRAHTSAPTRIVVWAHNTHSGDARATETGAAGEHNVAQLMRQRLGAQTLLVGFFTHHGTVMAAPAWDAPGRVFDVRPALPGSYADIFHTARPSNFLLVLRHSTVAEPLGVSRLERAIGVIYARDTERQSHYFFARLAQQFDVAVFFDETRAVTPLAPVP